jgi:hypothetical protein
LRDSLAFHGRFNGLRLSGCNIVQFCATQHESEMAEIPSVSNDAEAGENARRNSILN